MKRDQTVLCLEQSLCIIIHICMPLYNVRDYVYISGRGYITDSSRSALESNFLSWKYWFNYIATSGDVGRPTANMIMGMAMLAILVAMLTVRAEVGGLPLQQERYRRFQPGGGWGVGPGGGAGPGGPTTSPSTPGASPTNKPSNPGPQGPGGGSPLGIDTSGDPSGLKGETPTGATSQYPYYKKWRLDKELGDKLYAWNR